MKCLIFRYILYHGQQKRSIRGVYEYGDVLTKTYQCYVEYMYRALYAVMVKIHTMPRILVVLYNVLSQYGCTEKNERLD